MHGQYGFDVRMRGQGAIELAGIEIERSVFDIDEDGPRTGAQDRTAGGEKRERHGEDFVAKTNAGGHERQFQGIGSRCAADGETRAAVFREPFFEMLDFGSQHKALRFDGTRDRGLNGLAQGLVLTREIE